jgi:ribosomal 50S subunit-recycling heat shock protein
VICRIDVWLWRARFAKTRTLAAAMVERGAVRLTHKGVQTRLDRPVERPRRRYAGVRSRAVWSI